MTPTDLSDEQIEQMSDRELRKAYATEFHTWRGMIYRCTRKNDAAYRHYGGRGISVCERWMSLALFIKDMGKRPDGMSIERIDNDGNYEPSNCRWATRAEQLANQRRTHFVVLDGVRLPLRHAANKLGMDERTVHARIRRGWDTMAALTTPPDARWANPDKAAKEQPHG